MTRISTFPLTALLLGFAATLVTPAAALPEREQLGQLPPVLIESSGLATSQRDATLLWSHNDRGGEPVLYALGLDGQLRGSVRLGNATAHDWEDLAAFTLDGQAWLLVADTGDNHLRRDDAVLYLLPEPDPLKLDPARETVVTVPYRIPVRFPDGPQDCEGVAVDVPRREILLISKRASPPRVYRIPLVLGASGVSPPAEYIGPLLGLPRIGLAQLFNPTPGGMLRGLPTGLDISRDGRVAVVLTYGQVAWYQRGDDEGWAAALAREPLLLPPHRLEQAEAIAFAADERSVYLTSEGKNAPLLRLARPELPAPPASSEEPSQ